MPEPAQLRNLRSPVVIAAFGGWNDAGDAATGVVDHLAELTDAAFAFGLDPDEYYDFTSARPMVANTALGRVIEWPSVDILVGHLPERDLVLVSGPEPSFRWQSFCARIVSALRTVAPERVIMLGAMLADTPHRRPTPVGRNGTDYEGPTGIVGVLAEACRAAGFDVTSLWASVPHYVSEPPNPKATLALLGRVEDELDLTLDTRDLPGRAVQWEAQVSDLAAEDPDIQAYISSLEEHYDQAGETAEALADDVERFLRRRNR